MVALCSSPRVLPRLAPLPGSRYGKRLSEGLFVKKFFRRVKIKNYTYLHELNKSYGLTFFFKIMHHTFHIKVEENLVQHDHNKLHKAQNG
jgi:hypothetical protein